MYKFPTQEGAASSAPTNAREIILLQSLSLRNGRLSPCIDAADASRSKLVINYIHARVPSPETSGEGTTVSKSQRFGV